LKFTLAHELCHHIKDFEIQQQVTLNEDLDIPYSKVEKFANAFASYLLVPHLELKYKLDEFKGKQKLSDADIICLADFFEVSKSMITYRLDRLNISYDLGSGNLSTDIDLKIKLQYVKGVFSNSKKLFDSYRKVNIMEIVSNDSRFEGINLEIEEISEIIFDIEGFLDEGKILSKNEI
ncbi:TPA: ImmA/IrrE family metallo-endopeptidase, partial [Staphylococcus pseudintermedius]|nr:ImmA/IrrE family metallo-endopeptidase [Staphylococcus pseudintermedius]